MYKAFRPYPYHNLQVFLPEVFVCSILQSVPVWSMPLQYGTLSRPLTPINLRASSSLRPSVFIVSVFLRALCTYTVAFDKLGLHPYVMSSCTFFFVQVYRSLKSDISFLENISFCVPYSSLRDFLLFCACPHNKHCPSARCVYAALGAVSLNDLYAKN
jgi:hypothetical protein